MDTLMRKHLERALRVADFTRQHPSELPGYQDALARLEDRLAQISVVLQEEIGSRRGVKAAIAERLELRAQLAAELQMVAGIARTAGRESVGTPIVLRYPGPQRNQVQFLNGARQVVARAAAEEELLTRFGLPAGHLTSMASGLDTFAALLRQRDEASRGHVGARARLHALARELKAVVDQMDSINRFRFRKEPAMLAMWRTTRDLRVGTRKAAGATPAAEQPLALPPATPDVRPAA
jgi:hypothetical protein